MAGITVYAQQQLLNAALNVAGYTLPTSLWLSLYTVAPTSMTAGTEVVSTYSYIREQAIFGAASGPSFVSLGPQSTITFPTASGGSWGTVVAFGLMDSPTGDNHLWFFGPLSQSRTINNGDQLVFPVDSLSVAMG
jgi:hypothetical protein